MKYPMGFKCLDCTYTVVLGKRRARTQDGKRCPECGGALIYSPSVKFAEVIGTAIAAGYEAGLRNAIRTT